MEKSQGISSVSYTHLDVYKRQMKGHWTGLFNKVPEGTEIDFTEDVTAKKTMMKPFVSAYLKKQQKQYAEDLRGSVR